MGPCWVCQQNQASESPGCLPEAGEFAKVNATLRGLWEAASSLHCEILLPLVGAFLACYKHLGATSMAHLCFQLQVSFLTALEGRKQEKQPNLGVSLQSVSRESLSVQDLEQRNAGALIIVSAAVVEMPLTLASALVRIIITLEDPRQPSKLISCLCRVDGFFFPPSGS